MASPGKNNPELIEELISRLSSKRDLLSKSLDIIDQRLDQIIVLANEINHDIETYSPINARSIQTYVDEVNSSFSELVLIDEILSTREKLANAKSSLEQLSNYFYKQYMITVENESNKQ